MHSADGVGGPVVAKWTNDTAEMLVNHRRSDLAEAFMTYTVKEQSGLGVVDTVRRRVSFLRTHILKELDSPDADSDT